MLDIMLDSSFDQKWRHWQVPCKEGCSHVLQHISDDEITRHGEIEG